jgi:multiple sugar transport system substrate-binding protein
MEIWSQYAPGNANTRERATAYVLDSFKAKYPNINIKITTLSWQQMSPTLLRAAKAGKVPDVAMLYSPDMPEHIEAKTLLPLEKYLKRLTESSRKDIVRLPQAEDANGTIYGLPWEVRVSGLAYRADLLEKANKTAPKTLQEWSDTAAAAAAAAGGGVVGMSLNFSPEGSSIAGGWFITTLSGMGDKVLNADGTAAFDTPHAEKLVKWVYDQVHTRKPAVLPLDVALLDLDKGQDFFIAGKAVFLPTATQRYTLIKDKVAFGSQMQMVAYPTDDPNKPAPALVQSWSLVIPRGAKNPDLGWKLIEHWTSKEVQIEQSKIAGYVPTRTSALEDPYFDKPEARTIRWAIDHASKHPLKFKFPTNTSALYDTLARMFGNVLADKMTPKEALQWAEKDFNRVSGLK